MVLRLATSSLQLRGLVLKAMLRAKAEEKREKKGKEKKKRGRKAQKCVEVIIHP